MRVVEQILAGLYILILLVIVGIHGWFWVSGSGIYLHSLSFGWILIGWLMLIWKFKFKSKKSFVLGFSVIFLAVSARMLDLDMHEVLFRFGIMFLIVAIIQSIGEYRKSIKG